MVKIKEGHIQAIRDWQNNKRVHPLTCGTDSIHGSLQVGGKDGNFFLFCPICGFQQDQVPEAVVDKKKVMSSYRTFLVEVHKEDFEDIKEYLINNQDCEIKKTTDVIKELFYIGGGDIDVRDFVRIKDFD